MGVWVRVPIEYAFSASHGSLQKRETPRACWISLWRDPDSNRGHHDFQSCDRSSRTALKSLERVRSCAYQPNAKHPQLAVFYRRSGDEGRLISQSPQPPSNLRTRRSLLGTRGGRPARTGDHHGCDAGAHPHGRSPPHTWRYGRSGSASCHSRRFCSRPAIRQAWRFQTRGDSSSRTPSVPVGSA